MGKKAWATPRFFVVNIINNVRRLLLIDQENKTSVDAAAGSPSSSGDDQFREEEEEEVICDWCIDPISNSDPYYSCVVGCGYSVHATCVNLPRKIHTLKHPDHPLLLYFRRSNVGRFFCNACGRNTNGIYYRCQPCDLDVCLKCASVTMTETIAHSAHPKHLLTTQPHISNPTPCNGCGIDLKGYGFGCEKCHFYVCSECVLLPPSTKQKRWDEHPLILMYGSYFEHPDEFYCVLCEQEMNPNHWMYHCKECDYSFHVWCIPQIRLFRNLKFGRTLRVDNHPLHPLKHVPEAKYKSYCQGGCGTRLDWEVFECDSCGQTLKWGKAWDCIRCEGCSKMYFRGTLFECEACRFYLCQGCVVKNEVIPEIPHFSYN